MVALNVLRGLASLVPGLGGATYVGSQKPEGIEDVFKAATGTAGISRASESLTKEINVKKVADRLKAAGVDPETADKIAQGAIGQFGDAVIGDDEASTIAQDIGRGLEGGKPSGSAMIDFGGEEERGKMLGDPLITKPSEVGTEIKEGFSESEGIAQLPPFTEQDIDFGQSGFTEAKAMPTILTAEEESLKPNEIFFKQLSGVKNHNVERDPNDLFQEGWQDSFFAQPKALGKLGDYTVVIDQMKRSDNNFLLVKDGEIFGNIEISAPMGKGQEKIIELDAIGVPKEKQGKGIAKDILKNLFSLADANNITIQGSAQPFGSKTLNKKQLVEFYKSMGFKGDANNLVRKPVRPL